MLCFQEVWNKNYYGSWNKRVLQVTLHVHVFAIGVAYSNVYYGKFVDY